MGVASFRQRMLDNRFGTMVDDHGFIIEICKENAIKMYYSTKK